MVVRRADSTSRWAKPFYDMEVLSGVGYFVFYPNARGSLGFGEAFTKANVKDIGYGDFRDITTGVEDLLSKLPIDPRPGRDYRLELWRVHGNVGGDTDESF